MCSRTQHPVVRLTRHRARAGSRTTAFRSQAVQEHRTNSSFSLGPDGKQRWVDAMQADTLPADVPRYLVQLRQRYDPDLLEAAFSQRKAELNQRSVQVAGSLGLFISSVLRDYALGNLEKNNRRRGKELAQLLSRLGPSFVKVGQALSLRPDLLPKSYLEALSELQDGLTPFDSATAFDVLERQLGRPLEDMFSTITSEPVAAASLGQVYKATLAATGDVVAVKVQRPGIGESIAVDMLLLRRLLELVDNTQTVVSQKLVPLVDEFAARLFGELDYIAEGKNCEQFTKLYADVEKIVTPSIYWEYTSVHALTMEWIDGVKLTNKPAMDAAGLKITDFVDIGINATLTQLLGPAGLFHADPHPGNLLATPEGNLAYLDFGMMATAPEYARYAIIAHIVHLVNREYDLMCQDYYTLEFMDRSVDTAPIAPALADFFDDVLTNSVSQLNFKSIVDGLGGILFQYPFQVPAYYALILRSLTVLEGLALSADPEYKLLAKAYPYVARRLLTDPSMELRQTFEELILKDGRFLWNRLFNLLEESSRSKDPDPENQWLIAEWFLSDDARNVRQKMVEDVVKMVDANVAIAARQRIYDQSGSATLANRMIPQAAGEQMYASTLQRLSDAVLARTGVTTPFQADRNALPTLPTAASVQEDLASFSQQLSSVVPRIGGLLQRPAAQDMLQDLSSKIFERMLARSMKFLLSDPA